jgi:NAD(P)-dependent dehydrogenase (short-subunit alcohol dehydrogenase family)
MGVIHGIQAFVPSMIEHGEEGHIVNTSSVLGLSSGAGSTYGVSKHAVTRLTEGLHHDLRLVESRIGASVLCPGMIATNIILADRNRPAELKSDAIDEERSAMRGMMQERFLAEGMPPDEVGDIVFESIRDEPFYILTHPDTGIKDRVRERMDDIIEQRDQTRAVGFGMARGGG